MTLGNEDFRLVQDLMQRQASITLQADQTAFVEARLAEMLFRQDRGPIEAWLHRLRHFPDSATVQATVEALTIHETSFFRDLHPFEALKKVILPALASESRPLTIWSAACASGQEPYSLAMLLEEHFPTLAGRVQIIATDLSKSILARAETGRYSQFEVNRGLPASFLVKYFQQDGTDWVIRPDLRARVSFRPLNLQDAWPMMPPLDLVFMRNVMIYFSLATKQDILGRLRSRLRSDGYLFLGSSESLLRLDPGYCLTEVAGTMSYQLAPQAPGAGTL